jgi:hypothetical protein
MTQAVVGCPFNEADLVQRAQSLTYARITVDLR